MIKLTTPNWHDFCELKVVLNFFAVNHINWFKKKVHFFVLFL